MSGKLNHFVYYKKDTGDIFGISPVRPSDPQISFLEVPIESVYNILTGKELKSLYTIQYNPKEKKMEMVLKNQNTFQGNTVNDFIHEILPTDREADITLIHDIPNTCWKIQVGKELLKSIRQNGLTLNNNLLFSVTEKGDPNILYRTLFVDFRRATTDNYYIIPFKMDFETSDTEYSVYTSKVFDTYNLTKVLK